MAIDYAGFDQAGSLSPSEKQYENGRWRYSIDRHVAYSDGQNGWAIFAGLLLSMADEGQEVKAEARLN